jgi:hypothetical protein
LDLLPDGLHQQLLQPLLGDAHGHRFERDVLGFPIPLPILALLRDGDGRTGFQLADAAEHRSGFSDVPKA